MGLKIEKDLSRFHQVLRGQIKKELRKFMSKGEMFGRKGDDLISIPLPQIEIPRFVYGEKQAGGVGQGEGEPGQPVDGKEQKGASKAGNLPGEHIMEVEISIEELADILGEELELPKIEPKGQEDIVTEHTRYTSISQSGPESLRHFKRTYRKALRRQIMAGTYDPKAPRIIPIREDRVYRSWKTVKKPQSRALIFFLLDVSGCHTAGHYVEMANGSYKDIKDVEIGNGVCSIDLKSRRKVRSIVTETFKYKVPSTMLIKTEGPIALRATPNHHYFIYDIREDRIFEKRVDQLVKGDLLIQTADFNPDQIIELKSNVALPNWRGEGGAGVLGNPPKQPTSFCQPSSQIASLRINSDYNFQKNNRTLLFRRVVSIETIKEEVDVYDFEVEKHHNYLVDGILSHNSMGNEQKEIVRIETFWIDTWLRSQYQNLQTHYIIHDAVAREVDRETFFHTRESGGTIISSAYKLCLKIIQEQYSPNEWNIYPFHFSDGDNWSGNDTEECLKLLEEQFFPVCNVFAYGQVESEYGSGQFLKDLQGRFPTHEKLIISKIPNKEAIVSSIKDFLGKGK